MTLQDLDNETHRLQYTACMNQRYHQAKQELWLRLDRGTRILMGLLSAFSVIFSLLPNYSFLSIAVSVVSLLVAIALNVFPFGDMALHFGILFRAWTDLRSDIEELQLEIGKEKATAKNAPELLIENLQALTRRRFRIESQEPQPDMKLLNRCQEDENFRRYGVRKSSEIMEKKNQEPATTAA